MLLFGTVAVFSYLLYVVVLGPLSLAVERLEQKNEVASRSLNVVEALSKEYQSLKKKIGA